MDENKLNKKLKSRLNLDKVIEKVRIETNVWNITLATLESLQDDYYEGLVIGKRDNEAYIKGTLLWELITRETEDVVGQIGLDKYPSLVYRNLLEVLELYEVFQNRNREVSE